MFQDPDSMSKKAIPGMRAVRWERGYRVGIKNNDEDTASGLNDVVDGTFGAIESGVNGGSVLSGFKVCGSQCIFLATAPDVKFPENRWRRAEGYSWL
jgi:hypothetical protein